jgi:arylsulfatase A-like enzyme
LFEGGVRVPAFVAWHDHFEPGQRMDFPVVPSDYFPTIMDILDLDIDLNRPMDGRSILGLLDGKEKQRNSPIGFIFSQQISWVDDHYKLISQDGGNSFELYDLLEDKSERVDIIEQYPGLADKMQKELMLWKASVDQSQKGLDY